ncbi:MAG: DUF6111 family protein [Hyphomicrobiaceae bacterium]
MIRLIIENLLLLLAPTLIYLAYQWIVRREDTSGRQILSDAPLVLLGLMGITLMAIVLLFFANTHKGGKPGVGYVPPQVKDGKIVPGHAQ